MGGIWHTTVPITDEHVFLHLLRSVYLHQRGYERKFTNDYNAKLFAERLIEWGRVPSPYVKVYRKKPVWWKFPRWYVELTELGLFYCNYIYKYTDQLDCEKYSLFYRRDEKGHRSEKIPHAAARFRERAYYTV